MPYNCTTDKKWHFHHSNTVKSTVSNHFGSNALCYQELRSSLHQGAPAWWRGHITASPLQQKGYLLLNLSPIKGTEIPLADTALFFNRAWLGGLDSTREKNICNRQHD